LPTTTITISINNAWAFLSKKAKMVSLETVRASNAAFKASAEPGLVAVFVGGTSGLGESLLKTFAANASEPRIILVGRNEIASERISAEVKKLNSKASIRFIKGDVSLMQNVDAVCQQIKEEENKINYLVLSAGYLTFAGRTGIASDTFKDVTIADYIAI
jgi:short-subunit dehydrogenase